MFNTRITCLGPQAWGFISDESFLKRYEFVRLVEVAPRKLKRPKEARALKWRFNWRTGRATSAASKEKANEGGELGMAGGRRQVHTVSDDASAVPSCCTDGSSALDGSLPDVLRMSGFTIAAIAF